MQEENKRIKLEHPFSESHRTMMDKATIKRVWHCASCKKYYGAVLKLAEVALA
jgi:transcriptional regulator NrdR family protein